LISSWLCSRSMSLNEGSLNNNVQVSDSFLSRMRGKRSKYRARQNHMTVGWVIIYADEPAEMTGWMVAAEVAGEVQDGDDAHRLFRFLTHFLPLWDSLGSYGEALSHCPFRDFS
jgi:hypothetical protein